MLWQAINKLQGEQYNFTWASTYIQVSISTGIGVIPLKNSP